ncbi:MAG: hypothetical protein K6A38_00640 [Lachnospiraceae bacterium]|nr:hypothetical protein [Lachnospiraceae bacterium]
MNLKFYLRGLGIGIVVTAVIMLVIAHKANKPLSDAEIKQKAMALGMVENSGTLTDSVSNADQDTAPDGSSDDLVDESSSGDKLDEIEQLVDDADAYLEDIRSDGEGGDEGVSGEPTPEPDAEPTPEPTEKPEPTPEPTAKPTPEPTPEHVKEVEDTEVDNSGSVSQGGTFVINKGEDSYTIAKHLESAGYISDARAFDTYLCQNGYDRKLSAGTYSISSGVSKEELAKLLING